MKLKAILLLTLLSTVWIASAQKAGIKGGANFSNLYVDNVDDENMKIGFNAGMYYRAEASDNFGIQTELLFTQKGSEIQYGGLFGGEGRYRFNLNYLEVPVLAVFKVGNFHIDAGPYLGFLVGANVKDVNDDGSINDVENLDRDDFNTLDGGAAVGLGFDFPTGMLGVRYNYGFMEIGDSGIAGEATEDSKNSALQIFLGFDF